VVCDAVKSCHKICCVTHLGMVIYDIVEHCEYIIPLAFGGYGNTHET
jgi:hypothetical protein